MFYTYILHVFYCCCVCFAIIYIIVLRPYVRISVSSNVCSGYDVVIRNSNNNITKFKTTPWY
ncbi:unnamed protein product [Orchesella dallaii]|uniref:Uncharacterized protein n=1 Tax=Orchesella dallaii TaxID=48710 RepID=A0ABP1PZM5_9HEXA